MHFCAKSTHNLKHWGYPDLSLHRAHTHNRRQGEDGQPTKTKAARGAEPLHIKSVRRQAGLRRGGEVKQEWRGENETPKDVIVVIN